MFQDYRSIGWGRVASRVASDTWDDNVFGRGAELAYFALFSLLPLLLIVVVILGYIAQGPAMQETLLEYFRRAIPGSSYDLVKDTLTQVSAHATAGKLYIGVATTIWASSSAMTSVIDALNKAYDIREARPWWKARLLAAVLTIALAVLIVVALAFLLYGERIGDWVSAAVGGGSTVRFLWAILRWPVVVLFVLAGFLLLYRFAPDLHEQKLCWIIPGATAGVALWFLATFALQVYLRVFSSYSTVYGALGAVLILLLWLYVSSIALLVGGEVNSEIENEAARNGAADAKLAGEKSPRRGM